MVWTAPRTWAALDVVTDTMMNANVQANTNALNDRIQIVRKSTDQSITSSTTLTNDTQLVFTAVAGQVYVFDLMLIFNDNNSAIDAKVGFAFPAGTLSFQAIAMDPAVAAGTIGSGIWLAVSSATSGTSSLSVGAAAGDTGVRVAGSFSCTTGGTVTFMWAQNTSTASALLLKTGSTLTATRVSV